MCKRKSTRRERLRRRATLRVALLLPPALFWSVVFGVLAGLRPNELASGYARETAQLIVAAMCLLLAACVGSLFIGADAHTRLTSIPGRND